MFEDILIYDTSAMTLEIITKQEADWVYSPIGINRETILDEKTKVIEAYKDGHWKEIMRFKVLGPRKRYLFKRTNPW